MKKSFDSLTHSIQKPISDLRVAVVTPTYERALFLKQTYSYFLQQKNEVAQLHWFVIDDSSKPSFNELDLALKDERVHYEYLPSKISLGLKRNLLNQQAQNWQADIICAMDDDDWYGANYVHDLCEILLKSDLCFAGSGSTFYYGVKTGLIYDIPSVRENSTCNGFLAYKAFVLSERQYSDEALFAEEPQFLKRDPILQHPNPLSVNVALAHPNNTVTKRNYLHATYETTFTLDDLQMQEEDRAFYRGLKNALKK